MVHFKVADLFAAARTLLSTFPTNESFKDYFEIPLGMADRISHRIGDGHLIAEVDEFGVLRVSNPPRESTTAEVWDALNHMLYGLFFSGEDNRGPFYVNYEMLKPMPGRRGVAPAIANKVNDGDIHDVLYLMGMFGFDYIASVGSSYEFPRCPAPVHVRLRHHAVCRGEPAVWALETLPQSGKGDYVSLYRA